MEELGVVVGQELDLIVEGREARLKPIARKTRRYDIMELIAECDRIGWENQPPLENWSAVEAPWPLYEPGDRR